MNESYVLYFEEMDWATRGGERFTYVYSLRDFSRGAPDAGTAGGVHAGRSPASLSHHIP